MEIRRANPNDLTGIEAIEALSFSDPWQGKDILGYICSEDGMCFVATECGETIAYIVGRIIAPEGEIYRIATHPEKRGRGIAFRLLSYALKAERGRGLETTFLEVRSQNIPARRLYTAYGFNEIGIRRGYYKNPDDDAVLMMLGKLG